MSGYTPGPWRAVIIQNEYPKPASGSTRIIVSGLNELAKIQDRRACENGAEIGGAEANAILIAAAPELLEALIEMVDAADDEGQSERPMVVMARSAIRKATEAAS